MRSNDPLALLNRLAQWLGLCRLGGGFWRRRAPLHLRKRRRNDSTSRPLPRKDDPPPEPAASRQSASFLSLSLSPSFIYLSRCASVLWFGGHCFPAHKQRGHFSSGTQSANIHSLIFFLSFFIGDFSFLNIFTALSAHAAIKPMDFSSGPSLK